MGVALQRMARLRLDALRHWLHTAAAGGITNADEILAD